MTAAATPASAASYPSERCLFSNARSMGSGGPIHGVRVTDPIGWWSVRSGSCKTAGTCGGAAPSWKTLARPRGTPSRREASQVRGRPSAFRPHLSEAPLQEPLEAVPQR